MVDQLNACLATWRARWFAMNRNQRVMFALAAFAVLALISAGIGAGLALALRPDPAPVAVATTEPVVQETAVPQTAEPQATQTPAYTSTPLPTPTPAVVITDTVALTETVETVVEALPTLEGGWEYRLADMTSAKIGDALDPQGQELTVWDEPLTPTGSEYASVFPALTGSSSQSAIIINPQAVLTDTATGEAYVQFNDPRADLNQPPMGYIRLSDTHPLDELDGITFARLSVIQAIWSIYPDTMVSALVSEVSGDIYELAMLVVTLPELRKFSVGDETIHAVRFVYVLPGGELRFGWLAYAVTHPDGVLESFAGNYRGMPAPKDDPFVEDPDELFGVSARTLVFTYGFVLEDGAMNWSDPRSIRRIIQSGYSEGLTDEYLEAIDYSASLSAHFHEMDGGSSDAAFLNGQAVSDDFVFIPTGGVLQAIQAVPGMELAIDALLGE